MRRSRQALLALPLIAVGLVVGASVAAQAGTGTIAGVVFDDLDGDGLRDEGEPGLPDKVVKLLEGAVLHRAVRTDAHGSYAMDGLAPGKYSLATVLRSGAGICADYPLSRNPLATSWCFDFRLPWHARPDPVQVTVESAAVLQVDLGAQPVHVAVVAGIALLEDNRAPPGTLIEALVDGQECGRTEAFEHHEFNFGLHILGDREREGCAVTGDPVHFRVGGVPAAGTFFWAPFAYSPGSGYRIQHVVAMQEHAWYWMERFGDGLPAEDVVVQALVEDVLCGEALLRAARAPGGSVGFSRLIVPSEAIQPGCGRPGATVSFLVGGAESETTLAWQPGLQQIDLVLPGRPTPEPTVAPTSTPGTKLPETGRGLANHGPGVPGALIAALLASGALLIGGGLVLARRR